MTVQVASYGARSAALAQSYPHAGSAQEAKKSQPSGSESQPSVFVSAKPQPSREDGSTTGGRIDLKL